MSTYTLGTMMFGPYGNPDPDACVRIVHRALDHGGNGESERIVGKALRGHRDDLVLATPSPAPASKSR